MLNLPTSSQPAATNRQARRAERRMAKKKSAHAKTVTPRNAMLAAGLQHQQAGRLGDAETCFRQVIEAEPENPEAWLRLADLYFMEQGNPDAAYGCYKQAITLNSENLYCWRQFGRCLRDLQHSQAAVIAQRNAARLAPNDVDTLVDLAWALHADDQGIEALATFQRAVEIDPDDHFARYGKAKQHETLGDLAAARLEMLQVLEIDGEDANAYSTLVDVVEDPIELDELLGRIEDLIAKGGQDPKSSTTLHFALAIGRRRQKRYDDAFVQFAAGNAIRHKAFPADRDTFIGMVDKTIEGFQSEVFEHLEAAACDTDVPVFIIGMPRSGSTLVEQILTSHPDISTAGEFTKFGHIVELLSSARGGKLRYPQDIGRFEHQPLKELGANYLAALLHRSADGSVRVTDKRLTNFYQVGLLTVLFPNAKIIHCRRNPLDTCLSCYFQNFADDIPLAYTNDLENLGYFYRQYERIMAYWRAVLPDRMLELDYEDLVVNQEEVSRKLIDHVGLAWDDACLKFHTSNRSVRTASVSQVRQPIYKSSVAAWKNYETHLDPLKRALGIDD